MDDPDGTGVSRRRLLTLVSAASGGFGAAGRGGARPGRGPPGGGNGPPGDGDDSSDEGDDPPGRENGPPEDRGVGPCTCGTCPSGTFCGKIEGAPEAGKTYEFTDDGERFRITIQSVEAKENGEVTGFSFTSHDHVQKVCVKGGPNTATYTSDLHRVLHPPHNPGGNRPGISNLSFCGTDRVAYYQADIVLGDPITDLMPGMRYGDRLLAALVVSETGTYTGKLIEQPSGQASRTFGGGDCTVAWENFVFDPGTATVSANVEVVDTDGRATCPVTVALYRLPPGKTEVMDGMIGDQTYLDSETVALATGESRALDATV